MKQWYALYVLLCSYKLSQMCKQMHMCMSSFGCQLDQVEDI